MYFTMFRLVYLFVFRNDYEISDVTVFFFLLNNLIPIIKHNGRETFNFSIEIFTFHLSSSAKLKTLFSRKENLRECTSFEEQKGTRHIWGNVYFDIIVFSNLFSTKPYFELLLICLGAGSKRRCQVCRYQVSGSRYQVRQFHVPGIRCQL